MPKYKVTSTVADTYEIVVEAESQEVAYGLALDTDLDEWSYTGSLDLDNDIEEIEVGD
jgi:hypothetical protein